jgi:hypothetical protein
MYCLEAEHITIVSSGRLVLRDFGVTRYRSNINTKPLCTSRS